MVRIGFVTVGLLSVSFCVFADLEGALSKVAQYRAEMQAMEASQRQGDGAAYQKHYTNARGCLQEARSAFDAAEAANSDDPLVLRDYATVLLLQKENDLAVKAYQRAIKAMPEDAALWSGLGQTLSGMGSSKAADAVKALEHAIALDSKTPAAANAYACLARVYCDEGLSDAAGDFYKKALELDPAHAKAKLGMIALQVRAGKVLEASAAMNALRTLPPDVAEELPVVLSQALEQMERLHHSFEDTAENHMAYAQFLYRANRVPESLTAAERCAQRNGNDPSVWNFIGDLSQVLNNKERAKQAYTRSLQLKPDQPRTQERLDALNGPPTPLAPVQ